MAAYNKFNCYVEDVKEKKHNIGADTITVALCAAANAPVATNTVLANLTQISYANLSSRVVTISSSSQTSGTYSAVATNLVLTATGDVATFRYIVVYNDTASNDELIAWYDYADNATLHNGDTFTITFGATLFTLA